MQDPISYFVKEVITPNRFTLRLTLRPSSLLVRLHLAIEIHMVVVVEARVSGLHFRNMSQSQSQSNWPGAVAEVVAAAAGAVVAVAVQ